MDLEKYQLDKPKKPFKAKRNGKGQFDKGHPGNPHPEPSWIRKRFTADFLQAFHEHFRYEGKRVIAKVAKQQPAAYLRCLTLLVPKEMKVEHQGGVKAMSDEQLDAAMAALRQLLAEREAQALQALDSTKKVIDVTPGVTQALPAPADDKQDQ